MMADPTCRYAASGGEPCPEPAQGSDGLCFWHDPAASKAGPDVKAHLESLVRAGRSLEGFVLPNADLRGIRLTLGDTERRVNLSHADLSRADLTGAHLFNIDLRGSNLMKARLNGSNLNNARLDGTNLLGAEFEHARLERVNWGRHLFQEQQARAAHRRRREGEAMALYAEAEEVYRYLMGVSERAGHHTRAGHFYHKEKVMRRMQMRPWSRDWAWSKLVDLLCGYGEETDRVVAFSLGVILVCAVLYSALGVRAPEGLLEWDPALSPLANLRSFLVCLYYSVITFTTVGYGDITPMGASRAVAGFEAFTGAFSISLFVVVFIHKMMR